MPRKRKRKPRWRVSDTARNLLRPGSIALIAEQRRAARRRRRRQRSRPLAGVVERPPPVPFRGPVSGKQYDQAMMQFAAKNPFRLVLSSVY